MQKILAKVGIIILKSDSQYYIIHFEHFLFYFNRFTKYYGQDTKYIDVGIYRIDM